MYFPFKQVVVRLLQSLKSHQITYNMPKVHKNYTSVYLVHMMEDSLISSDQILAHQSPTVKKFFGKHGFRCKA